MLLWNARLIFFDTNSTFWFHVGAASSRDKCAHDDAISRQDAAPTSIFQGYFVRIQKAEILI
jgi:hypothetical protein